MRDTNSKILTREAMQTERVRLRAAGKRLVFTNGCFDILHVGHAQYLAFARQQGDALVVGLNSDSSVSRNKGPQRPIVPERERAHMIAALEAVDYVVIFDEDEPIDLITAVLPDILIKGKDWAHYVAGRDIVERNGGKVVLADFVAGLSTTNIIAKILGGQASGPPPGVPRARPPEPS